MFARARLIVGLASTPKRSFVELFCKRCGRALNNVSDEIRLKCILTPAFFGLLPKSFQQYLQAGAVETLWLVHKLRRPRYKTARHDMIRNMFNSPSNNESLAL